MDRTVENNETQRLLTVAEAARLCRVSRPTMYRLAHSEDVGALRVGGQIRIDAHDLKIWLYEDPRGTPGADAPAVRRAPDEASPAVEARQHVGETS